MTVLKNISIRKLEDKDLDAVIDTECRIRPEHHWSRDSFAKEITNLYAVYRAGFNPEDVLVGFYGFWQIIDEAHITTLSVNPDFRRQKVATMLLLDMVDICYSKKVKYITLEVRESNFPAISLYEKFGFTSIGIRKNYYQDNSENAVIMFTENIWYDKFKKNLENIRQEFGELKCP